MWKGRKIYHLSTLKDRLLKYFENKCLNLTLHENDKEFRNLIKLQCKNVCKYVNGYHFSMEGDEQGAPFLSVYKRVRGCTSRRSLPVKNFVHAKLLKFGLFNKILITRK